MAKYLYNGFPLPVLPAYDAAAFPYAIIVSANGENTSFILLLCANRPYYGTNPEDSTKTGVYNTGLKKVYTCAKEDSAWAFSMDNENPLTANDDDPGGGIIWTNPDILKTDGSVWMAGTQPVPERVSEAWVRSFKEGLALGLTGAPLPYTGTAEPVAYLYNGVRLPKLPEWDKERYPNALLISFWGTGWVLHIFGEYTVLDSPPNSDQESDWIVLNGTGDTSNCEDYLKATYDEATGQWEAFESDKYGGYTDYLSNVKWSSIDLYAYDGSLYLAASEPIPVYD